MRYRQIFLAAANSRDLVITDEIFEYVVDRLTSAQHELAYFQPNFLCEQVAQLCRCFALPRTITRALVDEALENLYTDLGHERP